MLPNSLIKRFDQNRLRNMLVLFFIALVVPTAVLIWQAYGQLKWEAFHQYRGVAEELSDRIDRGLDEGIRSVDAYSFADFTFLVISGDPSAKFLQRSPLSAYPVAQDLPGVLGYFQVDTQGVFSTPLLPDAGAPAANVGISDAENEQRLQLAQEIQSILVDNRLVRSRLDSGVRRGLSSSLDDTYKSAPALEAGQDASHSDPVNEGEAAEEKQIDSVEGGYSQLIFDQLNQPREDTRSYSDEDGTVASGARVEAQRQQRERANRIGKVSDLKLDADLQKKSEDAERDKLKEQVAGSELADSPGRSKRKEQIALPESLPVEESAVATNAAAFRELRISTFESEIDPFEFSLLDSGHFVLFRKVWREGERFIQGILLDQEAFIQDIAARPFRETAVSDMSNLIIAYQDDVIRTFGGRADSGYSDVAADLDGSLLYRSRLTTPFASLELIFGVTSLPPGPGASVLGWVTFVLVIVFVGGFVTLYRAGLSQIHLARQQQDFVSAVSHELKSPLTSIRMYGEMLKEGWADEDKRQGYYEFIHDESERLSRLISNVLQLANITRNEPQFELKLMTVAELMANAESKIANQIERAGFALNFNKGGAADDASIYIDEDCFAQILINLVDNAIKFSRNTENKTIEIGSKLSADENVVFSVRDYGPGVQKDQMKKIFQLFYRTESELTRETVGTGIGLAIVHQLTLAMNGSVDLVNAEPGAEFRIRFPAAAPT